MFSNYSQTYSASIVTIAGFIAVLLSKYGVSQSDVELILGTVVSSFGIIWQLYHRYSKGGVSTLGIRT